MTDPIFAVRRFNRFYTRLIGALDVDFLGSDVTLPEAMTRLMLACAAGREARWR